MAMPFSPRVVYNAVTFNFTLPAMLHTPVPEPVGKVRRATSGATETMLRSHFQLAELTLRFTEAEWSDVYAWIRWAHANGMGTFTWRLDQSDAATQITAYLETPSPEGKWKPDRDEDDAGVWTLPIVLRVSTDTLVDIVVFP